MSTNDTTTDYSDEQEPIMGELVPANGSDSDMAGQLMSMTGDINQAVHNFKGEGVDLLKFVSRVTGPDVMDGDSMPADGISLQYIYCHPVQVAGPTDGEVVDAYRTVLVSTDNKCYGFVSDGVFRSAVSVFQAYKFGPINPPLKVKLGVKKTRKGRKMLMLTFPE